MPSTTIHFPPETLERLDAVAKRRGISRNRLVIEACERAVSEDAGKWPAGFFETELGEEDLAVLRRSGREMEQHITESRRNRGAPIL